MMPCGGHNETADHFTFLSGLEMAFQNYVHAQTCTENPQVMINADFKVNH
jgi:hypothetical protein